jgi:hypothetical protein
MTVRRTFLAVLPRVPSLLIFAFGFGIGRYQVARTLRRQTADSLGSDMLDRMVANSEKGTYGIRQNVTFPS